VETVPESAAGLSPQQRGEALAKEAAQAANEGDTARAISLIEQAIRLDAIGALNRYHEFRAELYLSVGRGAHHRALMLYSLGVTLAKKGHTRDAIAAYETAHMLDPLFLWPLNNLAWMLSTRGTSSVRDGRQAINYAKRACEQLNMSCWAFLGTLAAAHARVGDFEKAVEVQTESLRLAPDDHKAESEDMLRSFRSGSAYVDEGQPVAAGGTMTEDEIAALDDDRLKDELRALIATRRTAEH
jgi:tetratricopeptide (TPR) repeat protein